MEVKMAQSNISSLNTDNKNPYNYTTSYDIGSKYQVGSQFDAGAKFNIAGKDNTPSSKPTSNIQAQPSKSPDNTLQNGANAQVKPANSASIASSPNSLVAQPQKNASTTIVEDTSSTAAKTATPPPSDTSATKINPNLSNKDLDAITKNNKEIESYKSKIKENNVKIEQHYKQGGTYYDGFLYSATPKEHFLNQGLNASINFLTKQNREIEDAAERLARYKLVTEMYSQLKTT
jgi:hypothetical protein